MQREEETVTITISKRKYESIRLGIAWGIVGSIVTPLIYAPYLFGLFYRSIGLFRQDLTTPLLWVGGLFMSFLIGLILWVVAYTLKKLLKAVLPIAGKVLERIDNK